MTIRGWIAPSTSSYYARTRNSAWTAASMLFLACALSIRAHAGVSADAAAVAAAKIMTPEELVRGLSERDPGRRLAYRDETLVRGAASVPALVAGMTDDRRRRIMLAVLERMGETAVPKLIEMLADRELGVRAASVLAQVSGPKVASHVPAFLACLQTPELANSCGMALIKAAPKAGAHLPVFLAALKDSRPEIRAYSAAAIGQIESRPRAAVAPLIVALKDPEVMVRMGAVAALGRMGKKAQAAVPILKTLKQDPSSDVRVGVAQALKNIDG